MKKLLECNILVFRCHKISITSIAFLLFNFCFFHSTILYSSYTGGQPAEFLQFGASAKAMAIKSFYSISDDATAVYYNPAGLVQCDRKEITALHTELFPNTQTIYDYIGFVYPTVKYGVFSVALNQLLSSDFEKIEITFDPLSKDIIKIENKGTFEDRQIAFLAGYAREVMEHVNVGVGMKYVTRKLDVISDTMVGFDISVLVIGINSRLPKLNLAAGIKNLVSAKMGTEDDLPMIFKFGGSYKFLRDRLLVGLDIEQNINSEMKWMLGTEYWLLNFLALRIGFEGLSYLKETTAGIGGKYQDYSFDYSFAYHELGFSHRVSAGMKWGASVKFDKEEVIKKLMNETIALYTAGKFMESAKRAEAAYQIDPNRKELKKLLDNLLLVSAYIPNATDETEEQQGIRKAVNSLVENDLVGTVNSLRYSYYKNPDNRKLHELLNRIEQMAGMTLTEKYKDEISGWTIIDKKIYEAREDILNGRYTDAIRRSQEILNLEPKNITALEIMGSAFFMMNEPEKAKKVWLKVLEYDPTNKVIQQFLRELE